MQKTFIPHLSVTTQHFLASKRRSVSLPRTEVELFDWDHVGWSSHEEYKPTDRVTVHCMTVCVHCSLVLVCRRWSYITSSIVGKLVGGVRNVREDSATGRSSQAG